MNNNAVVMHAYWNAKFVRWVGLRYGVIFGFTLLMLFLPKLRNAFWYTSWTEEFALPLIILTIAACLLLVSVCEFFRAVSRIVGTIIFAVLIVGVTSIRMIDSELLIRYGMSYSPRVFAHTSPAAFDMALTEHPYFLVFFGIVFIFSAALFWWVARPSKPAVPWLLPASGFTVIFILSVTLLAVKWGDHAARVFPEALLFQQLTAFMGKKVEKQVGWQPEERLRAQRLGFDLQHPNSQLVSSINGGKPNLLIIFLEGFNAEYSETGGAKFVGISPNLDQFAKKHTYVENFYNGVDDTINSLVSAHCGFLTQFSDSSWEKGALVNFAADAPCLSDVLNDQGYETILLNASSRKFAGTDAFSQHHSFDRYIGKEDILLDEPRYGRSESASLYDADLVEYTIGTLKNLPKEQPFFLTVFTMDTHHPFKSAPECSGYKADPAIPTWDETTAPKWRNSTAYLNTIYCSDAAIGQLLSYMKQEGFYDNTAIIITGDHRNWRDRPRHNRVFMTMYSPVVNLPSKISIDGYTPDIAPTALELLGFDMPNFHIGRSLLSSRKQQQHLVAPNFDLFQGKISTQTSRETSSQGGDCSSADLEKTQLLDIQRHLTSCERKKLMFLHEEYLLSSSKELIPSLE